MSTVPVAIRIIRRETQAALQVIPLDTLPFVWLPKSQLEDADNLKAGDRDIVIEVPAWLVSKHGTGRSAAPR